mgnify:CR=1 FL=1
MPRAGGQKKLSKEALKAYRGPFPTRKSRYPTYVFPRELRGSHAFFNEVADNLSHLSHLPLLLTWGEADPALSMERFGHRFEQTFPNHHTVILEGAGHFFQEEVPEQVTAAVRQWWKDKIHT